MPLKLDFLNWNHELEKKTMRDVCARTEQQDAWYNLYVVISVICKPGKRSSTHWRYTRGFGFAVKVLVSRSARQPHYCHGEEYHTESSRGSDLSDIMEEDEEELYSEMQLEDGGRRRVSVSSHNALKVSGAAQNLPRDSRSPLFFKAFLLVTAFAGC